MKDARKRAKKADYNPSNLYISDKENFKLMIKNKKVGYGDYLIYKHLEKNKEVPKGYADKKRNTYINSHIRIRLFS